MKSRVHTKHCHVVFRLMLFVFCLFMCVGAWGDNTEFMQAYNFQCYSKGPGILHFKLLAFSCGGYNHWAGTDDGKYSEVLLSNNGSTKSLLKWWVVNDNNGQRGYNDDDNNRKNGLGQLTLQLTGEGTICVTNMSNGITKMIGQDAKNKEIALTVQRETAADRYRVYLEFDWYAPAGYMEKSWTAKCSVIDERSISTDTRDYNMGTFDLGRMPEAPELYEPVLSGAQVADATDKATAMVPYSSTTSIQYIKTSTGDSIISPQQGGTFAVATEDYSYALNAVFAIDYNRSGFYMPVTSNTVTVPAYHAIHDMSVVHEKDTVEYAFSDGSKKLMEKTSKRNLITWTTHYSQYVDAVQQDVFTIERAHKSDFSDAQSIGSVNMKPTMTSYKSSDSYENEADNMIQTYTFVDENPYYSLDDSMGDSIYYRVRRSTASLWGWNHRYAASASIANDLHLAALSKEGTSISATADGKGVEISIALDRSDKAVLESNMNVTIIRKDELGIESKVVVPTDSLMGLYKSRTEVIRTSIVNSDHPDLVHYTATTNSRTGQVVSQRLDIGNTTADYVIKKVVFFTDVPRGSLALNGLEMYDSRTLVASGSSNRVSIMLMSGMSLGNEIEITLESRYFQDYHYTEKLPAACTEYTYSIKVDTSMCVIPRMKDDPNYCYSIDPLKTSSGQSSFYFTEIPEITSLKASQGKYLKQVVLEWETSSPGTDYFDVICDGKTIATQVRATCYVDSIRPDGTLLVPGHEYTYQVVGHLNCNGNQQTMSPTAKGWRSQYGRITGRILLADGTAMANVSVMIKPENGGSTLYAVTDERGFYKVENVAYNVAGGTQYTVTPQLKNGTTDERYYNVVINSAVPEPEIPSFVCSSIARISGRLLYSKSTVPVVGASFKVNGYDVLTASGNAVKTDNLGNFTITVPLNTQLTLQAVRQGHTFENDGFVLINGSNTITLSKNLDGVRIWDTTRIHLTGRIAGGNVQASLPLGQGLSKNNIGDDLQFVLELEDDNISHLVYDENDRSYTEDTLTFVHATKGEQTFVHYGQKRITVQPDIKTGEFELDLIPANYKITQMIAKGYSTLLAAGTGIPTLKLCNETSNATYVHTYHGGISVTYNQMLYGMLQDYLGERQMMYYDLAMEGTSIETTWKDKNGKWQYAFGHPVFKSGSSYSIRVSAHEDFYYNNDKTQMADVVMLANCPVRIYNGLNDASDVIEGTLDENGMGIFTLRAANASFSMTGEDALRTADVSVLSNGEYIMGTPLKGYVTGSRQKANSVVGNPDVKMLSSQIVVNDVLRDPPGSKSYAFIESGTTYETEYQMHYNFQVGANIKIQLGANSSSLVGTVEAAPGPMTGLIMQTTSMKEIPIPAYTQAIKSWQKYTYSFETTNRIQTSNAYDMVGDDATIFIGSEPAVYAMHNESMCVIDKAAYRSVRGAIQAGKVRVISSGVDEKGDSIYLVIGEQMSYGTALNGHFAYTRKYIIEQLIPSYLIQRSSLLVTGDRDELQRMANASNRAIYHSLVEPDDPNFGIEKHYEVIYPSTWSEEMFQRDEVKACNDYIVQWMEVLVNEEATQLATSRMTPYTTENISGGIALEHTETTNISLYNKNKDEENSMEGTVKHGALSVLDGIVGAGIGQLWDMGMNHFANNNSGNNIFTSATENFKNLVQSYQTDDTQTRPATTEDVKGINYAISFSVDPVFDINQKETNGKTNGWKKTVGYHLEDTDMGNLSIGIHRMTEHTNGFNQMAYNYLQVAADYEYSDAYNTGIQTGDFVYTLMAGATRCPYEGPVVTRFVQPGSIISNGTMNLEEIHLGIDKHEVNNVPQDGCAYFDLSLSVSSQIPVGTINIFPSDYRLLIDNETNDKGAILTIDGQPLSNGIDFELSNDGRIVHKTLKVERGNGFDFDNIRITLSSECDRRNYSEATFSVHFMPTSSPVHLSRISQNWVMNTLSPRDSVGYYLPVEIDGFDTSDGNFDHIEFQYKLSSESDDSWVNQCSYYPATDTLRYLQASGNKEMFSSGIIPGIHFYGERDPMEQQYDLRAVTYTRHGSAFITNSSEVLTGVKDTRCPELLGVPLMQDGVLRFNDYINIPFSEPIAGNYLDEDNNFEIVGYTNQDGITRSTSLYFDGSNQSQAASQVSRSVGENGFTIDMMVRPAEVPTDTNFKNYLCITDETGESQMIFGKENDRLALSMICLSGDSVLKTTSYSKPVGNFIDWTRVAVTYDHSGEVHFYVGSADMTAPDATQALKEFSVRGPLGFGMALTDGTAFKGNMLEARLWNRALEIDEIATYNQVRLNGHEDGLLAYYPMNDGQGNVVADKAHGADLTHIVASWTRPEGLSLQLPISDNDGIRLEPTPWTRNGLQDYTLSLWFKAQPEQVGDTVTLFAAGAGTADEVAAEGHLFIGLNKGAVMVRQNGHTLQSGGNYLDDNWHSVGLIVNHGLGEARLYVDNNLIDKCDATDFAGIDGNNLFLGATHSFRVVNGGDDEPQTIEGNRWPFAGLMDEITLWETALSETYFKLMANQTPNPYAIGLLCNLSFQRNALNGNSIYETVYSPYNTKIYTDALTGEDLNTKVRLVRTSDEEMQGLMVAGTGPVRENDKLSKLNFNWTSKDNELVVNLNMADREINKQNVFITLRDVEDMAGNKLVNPVSFTVYVDRSPVYWIQPYYNVVTYNDEQQSFNLDITNVSGKTTNYRITDLPSWLSCDETEGYITPAATKAVPFVLNGNGTLTLGEHLASICLVTDDGLTETIDLNVKCLCNEPNWNADRSLSQSMSVIGQVNLANVTGGVRGSYIDDDEGDIVGAFIGDICAGTAHISSEVGTNANLMISVRGKGEYINENVTFRLWKANSNVVYILEPATPIVFKPDSLYGSASCPVIFNTTTHKVQNIEVQSGWNWISFCYKTPSALKELFVDKNCFSQDDIIKTYYGSAKFSTFQETTSEWKGSLNTIDYHNIYMVNLKNDATLSIDGYDLDTDEQRTITLTHGWTQLPYLLNYAQPLDAALADYFDFARDGDIVKSYQQFAVFDESRKQWIGSLKMMQPGVGYLLRRTAEEPCNLTFHDTQYGTHRTTRNAASPVSEDISECYAPLHYETNMSLIAVTNGGADGLKSQSGDILTVLYNGEIVGRAIADEEGRFFLTVSAPEKANVNFLLTRGDDVIGSSTSDVQFVTNLVSGTLAKPHTINLFSNGECYKILDHNHIYIILTGKRYNVEGLRVK